MLCSKSNENELYGLLSHVCHAGLKTVNSGSISGLIYTMENFLKSFLETGTTCSLGKLPCSTDGIADSNIRALQKVIFKPDVLVEFKEMLRSTCSRDPVAVRSEIARQIIKCLSNLLSSDEDVKVKADIFSDVFLCFAASCKGDDGVLAVQFFVVLCNIIGMNAKTDEDADGCGQLMNEANFQSVFQVDVSCCSTESFIIFKELLVCLSKTCVNMNSPEVQLQNKWLQQLLKNLANYQPFKSILMEIFLIAANVNLRLLEGNLDCIFNNILVHGLPDDKNFWDSYGRFLESVLNISAKFQRTTKFISRFLTSLKSSSSDLSKEVILPCNVIIEFSETVRTASNQQCILLFDVLLENIQECFNNISKCSSGSKLLMVTGATSELLICFLKEVKLYAPGIVSATLQAFIGKLCIFQRTLQTFGNYLFSNKSFMLKNAEIVEMFLGLCFYCGEIKELVNCYRDSILQDVDMSESVTDCDWQCCLSLEQWQKLANYVLKSKLETCSSVCFRLALQHLRISKLENRISPDYFDEPTLKIILERLTSSHKKFNIFERLPPDDLSILVELVPSEQARLVGRHILKQIQESENEEEWATWLSDPALQENSVFVAALFSEVLNETGSLLRNFSPERNHPGLSWLSEEYLRDRNSADSLERLPEKINDLLRKKQKVRKSLRAEGKDSLARTLKVFKLLPLHHMKEDLRKLGLSFAVGVGTLLADEGRLASDSLCRFLSSDVDASTCFDVGLCIKWLGELSTEDEAKTKAMESLVRNSPNMKFGLNQLARAIDSAEAARCSDPMKMLKTRVVLYNELGKCWQRAKKRKSDNDLIGSCRAKLAKKISDEARQLHGDAINPENCAILLKILTVELNQAARADEEEQMANFARHKFPAAFRFAVDALKGGFDEPSAAFLTFVLQSLPRLRKFVPEDSFWKIWKALKTYEKVNWRLFCSHSSEEEFGEVLDDLLRMSKKFLSSESSKHSSNCFEIWVSFFEASSESKRSGCQLRLQQLFKYVHECHLLLRDLPIERKYSLIKFFSFCLNNKEVLITSHVVDTVVHVILECPDEAASTEDFRGLFALRAEVASAVLLRQFAWSRSKVHLTFVTFKRMLASLMARCNAGEVANKEDVIKLSDCAFCLEKWTRLMVKKEKDFARTSAYFITALVSSIASVTVVPAVKFHLVNCINHFLSISDSHTFAYLMRILKPGYQQVFNTLYNQFKKYHKYSGKI